MKIRLLLIVVLALGVFVPVSAFAQDGGFVSYGAYSSSGFAGGVFTDAICDLIGLIEGDLGGLLTAAALCMGIALAAFGNLKGVPAAIVVAVGAFTISAGVSLYFGDFGCGGSGGGSSSSKSQSIISVENTDDFENF